MKILVIQQKMIGDVLASTVICQALKEWNMNAEVHYMIHPNTKPVTDNNPYIDKIILFDPAQIKGLSNLINFGKELSDQNYDAVIDAYGKWESIIPAYFSKAPKRIGFYKWYNAPFYTDSVTPEANVPGSAIHHRLQLAKEITGKIPKLAFPKIHLTDAEIFDAKAKVSNIRDKAKLVMISVLGSDLSKSLPFAQMAEIMDIIAENQNVKMLLNFMPSQEAEAREIYSLCKPETQGKIIFDLYMKGLRPFLAVLSQCDALIGNEGGAVNMAKAVGIPTFTIFSPWINKSSWNMLTENESHIAVHLEDYFPEMYKGKHPKEFKQKVESMYRKLKPALFADELKKFVERITS